MRFSYNDRTHRLESEDSLTTAENYGSKEDFYKYILRSNGQAIVFEAIKEQNAVDDIRFIRWTLSNISSRTHDHPPHKFTLQLDLNNIIDVISDVLRCTDGWSNKTKFQVIGVDLAPLVRSMLTRGFLQ